MRRNRLILGWAVAVVALAGGCAQTGAAGGASGSGTSGGGVSGELGELGDAILALDSDNPPDPASSQVHLLVIETACAGGKPADGRVVLEHLAQLEDRVELVIGVEAQPGEQTCPSNPPTPFTVELDEPLGDRTLVDVAVYPAQELTTLAYPEAP